MNIPLLLASACVNQPHPDTARTGGEDSCFVSRNNNAIGVADGVGGWTNTPGSDSAKYSRDLMTFSNESSHLLDSMAILNSAFERIDKTVPGSSTATVAKLTGTNLSIANVGDSGCSLYRNFNEIYHTNPTLHGFNFPYQLGYQSDTAPDDGTHDLIPIEDGDILVCASDGLWDNLYPEEIQRIVQEHAAIQDPWEYAHKTAAALVSQAVQKGGDSYSQTPFSDEVRKLGYEWQGGKLDDTTVVVSRVYNFNEDL